MIHNHRVALLKLPTQMFISILSLYGGLSFANSSDSINIEISVIVKAGQVCNIANVRVSQVATSFQGKTACNDPLANTGDLIGQLERYKYKNREDIVNIELVVE